MAKQTAFINISYIYSWFAKLKKMQQLFVVNELIYGYIP